MVEYNCVTMIKIHKHDNLDCETEWTSSEKAYGELLKDRSRDSTFLRHHGLESTLIRLIGDPSKLKLLDIGCGNGWLFDLVEPVEGHECDIVRHQNLPSERNYTYADIRKKLPFQSNYFDITVASLVLIWLDNIDNAVNEIYRVTKSKGRTIISLMHPYFYRTGDVDENDEFIIKSDLSQPFSIEGHKIGGVVGPFTYYYRPLNDYINELINVGFRIKYLGDWFINMDEYQKIFLEKNSPIVRRTGKVPMYTFIECVKD